MENITKYNTFLKPEKPFLLIYTDFYSENNDIGYAWLETEEELKELIDEVKRYGCEIQDAIEIGSVREIDFNAVAD